MIKTKSLVITGLMAAIGVVLPLAFHTVPNAGKIFLPMHIPVILCGFAAGPIYGLICGIIAPLISSVSTGMPSMAIIPGMLFELATYGFVSGAVIRFVKTPNALFNVYLALIVALICGRCVSGFTNGLIFMAGKYSFNVWLTASFVTAIPGIIIQLVVVPALVFELNRAGLIELETGLKLSRT
ncbi:MAG: ECF transporter S component [Clostridia bacterium]